MRLNLYAGPGASKSTTSAWLFSELKTEHYSVELITEYVKSWACQKREVKEFDQILLMGKQMNYEYRFLSSGVKNVITDSPVLLCAFYTRAYFPKLNMPDHMEAIIMEYEKAYPSVNIFIDRKDRPYSTEGRYQTREQAVEMDKMIKDSLDRLNIKYETFDFDDRENILKYAKSKIE
jgi:hypothetical protein